MQRFGTFSVVAGAMLLCAMPFSPQRSHDGTLALSLDRAEARVGQPLTPGSVAGVNRRVNRRAYRHSYYGSGANYFRSPAYNSYYGNSYYGSYGNSGYGYYGNPYYGGRR